MKAPFHKSAHIQIITDIARGLRDAGVLSNYLELGVQRGACFNSVAPLAEKAFAVDVSAESFDYISGNKNLSWFHGETTKFLTKLDSIKFDLVFIDADHHHEASLSDFDNVFPHVNDNGFILLHDTYPPNNDFVNEHYCGDTYKTAWYIRNEYRDKCEIVTLPFYMGISIVRKSSRQLMWG